mmetsp:Transcript_56227/g.119557  ORF Transcript_56227/g.119557 Transcript_56227/m.119557 type:complete len:334 (+) Transcript_56227:1219-2220(+)
MASLMALSRDLKVWTSPESLAISRSLALSTSRFRHSSRVGMTLSSPSPASVEEERPNAAAGNVECRLRTSADPADSSPTLASSSMFNSVASPRWRNTCFSSTEHLITSLQHFASKANPSLLSSTGGSWKKSPHTTSCTPPNERLSLRALDAMKLSLSRNEPAIMDISSITKMSTSLQRPLVYSFPITRLARSAGEPFPAPTPAKLCIVTPPTLHAATPVVAVMTIFRGCPFFPPMPISLASNSAERMCDFPLPAGPVKKVEWPDSMDSTTRHCSSFRVERESGGRATVIGGGFASDLRNCSFRKRPAPLAAPLLPPPPPPPPTLPPPRKEESD